MTAMTTATQPDDITTTDDTSAFLIAVTLLAWTTVLVLALVWWRDLGVDRFEEFVARIIMLGFAALGASLAAIVAALVRYHHR